MGAIRLTERQLERAAERMSHIFEKRVDTNDSTYVYSGEVKKVRGKGSAAVKKFWKATQYYAGRGKPASLVSLTKIDNRISTALRTLKKAAANKGNKDGRLDGTKAELGSIKSESAKALARFAHAIKR